jgi:hypothetical protein
MPPTCWRRPRRSNASTYSAPSCPAEARVKTTIEQAVDHREIWSLKMLYRFVAFWMVFISRRNNMGACCSVSWC